MTQLKRFVTVMALAVCCVLLTGCPETTTSTADTKIQQKQERLQDELIKEVGLPNITRFTEAKRMRYLYELRDRADLSCWIYTRDLPGKLHLIGVGIGYPLPYGTQFSNPSKLVSNEGYSSGAYAKIPIPQAEPNGLFMPPGAEASWVILMTKRGPKPYYAETRLEGVPERIFGADETQAIWPDGNPIPPEVVVPPPTTERDNQVIEEAGKK